MRCLRDVYLYMPGSTISYNQHMGGSNMSQSKLRIIARRCCDRLMGSSMRRSSVSNGWEPVIVGGINNADGMEVSMTDCSIWISGPKSDICSQAAMGRMRTIRTKEDEISFAV
jgi:hypothetical protein